MSLNGYSVATITPLHFHGCFDFIVMNRREIDSLKIVKFMKLQLKSCGNVDLAPHLFNFHDAIHPMWLEFLSRGPLAGYSEIHDWFS